MMRDRFSTALTAALLAFFTAWGCTGCLISAFDLCLQYPVLPMIICGIWAIGTAFFLSFRHGGIFLLCILALSAGYICQDGTALLQLKNLITQLSSIYDRAYGWGILTFSTESGLSDFTDWPLCIWGALISIIVCRSICRQKSLWLPAIVTILPLCSCIVVTDTVPDEAFLLMVMAGLVLLMLTASVRKENPLQADRLTSAAIIPVLLALGGLFLAVPQESYVNHSAVLRENILTAVRNLPQLMENGAGELGSALQTQPPKQVNLAALGDRIPFTYPVMEVTAEQSGTLYLRQQDYDRYDGLGWTCSENRTELFPSVPGTAETIHIQTKTGKLTRYLPYHPAMTTELVDGSSQNPEKEQDYTVLRYVLPDNWRQTAYEDTAGTPAQWQVYCSLPEATRQGAAVFLEQLFEDNISNTAKADIIAALVTDSARYNTRPGKMPSGKTDFALWFLQEGESGYCVHFATAATVLLRAAGIPARYVTGYMLEAEAGKTVTVTEENAHAWAEYYAPNLGVWLPLEATPASSASISPPPLPSAAESKDVTVPTEPEASETQPVTEADFPSEPTPSATAPVAPSPDAAIANSAGALLFLPALFLLLALQRTLRLAFRRRYQHTGSPNQQALHRWQEAVRLARLLKEIPTEELIILAQKAKFSQYALTPEELQQFDSFQRTCLRRLRDKPWYLQLIYKYIHAAY